MKAVKVPVHIPLSGKTMEFDAAGNARRVAELFACSPARLACGRRSPQTSSSAIATIARLGGFP